MKRWSVHLHVLFGLWRASANALNGDAHHYLHFYFWYLIFFWMCEHLFVICVCGKSLNKTKKTRAKCRHVCPLNGTRSRTIDAQKNKKKKKKNWNEIYKQSNLDLHIVFRGGIWQQKHFDLLDNWWRPQFTKNVSQSAEVYLHWIHFRLRFPMKYQ